MIIKTKKDIPASEITDPLVFKKRRQIIKAALATMLTGGPISSALANSTLSVWGDLPKSPVSNDSLTVTPAEITKNHTNYYEFSFNKQETTSLA